MQCLYFEEHYEKSIDLMKHLLLLFLTLTSQPSHHWVVCNCQQVEYLKKRHMAAVWLKSRHIGSKDFLKSYFQLPAKDCPALKSVWLFVVPFGFHPFVHIFFSFSEYQDSHTSSRSLRSQIKDHTVFEKKIIPADEDWTPFYSCLRQLTISICQASQ